MGTQAESRYADVNWAEIYRQLYSVAQFCTRHVPDIIDGKSAEDVVGIVLVEFFASETALGWTPEKGSLNRFLVGVLRHKISDCLRRQKRIAGSLDDPDFGAAIVEPALSPEPQRPAKSPLQQAASGDRKLEELVVAMGELDGDYNINQQIAGVLHISVKEVVNRKRRLIRRVLKSKNLS